MVAEPMSYAFKSIRMEPVSKNLQILLQGFEKTAGAKGAPSLIRDESVEVEN